MTAPTTNNNNSKQRNSNNKDSFDRMDKAAADAVCNCNCNCTNNDDDHHHSNIKHLELISGSISNNSNGKSMVAIVRDEPFNPQTFAFVSLSL